MEARVSVLTPNRFLFATVLSGLLAAASSAAADATKDQCIAANESAQDLRQAGKLREARQKLTLCLATSCPGLLRQDCAQLVNDIDAAMPTIVFEVKDSAGNDLDAVRVTMDGAPFAEAVNGTAIPADPGSHRFGFEAEGLARTEKILVLREGDKSRHERVILEVEHPEAVSEAPVRARSADSANDGNTQRFAGLALGGAGVVGLVVGSVWGLVSKSTYDHALNSECGTAVGFAEPKTCNQAGYNDVQSAHGQATASTIAFIAGAALVGGGAYFYLSAPKGEQISVRPSLGSRNAGITLQGTW
jgi:hypothetical protein